LSLYVVSGCIYCAFCPLSRCAVRLSQMMDQALSLPADTRQMILSPLIVGRKGQGVPYLPTLSHQLDVRPGNQQLAFEFAGSSRMRRLSNPPKMLPTSQQTGVSSDIATGKFSPPPM
jgi:hypothetical protein